MPNYLKVCAAFRRTTTAHVVCSLILLASFAAFITSCATRPPTTSDATPHDTLHLTSPASRLVYQCGSDGTARLRIAGSGAAPGATLEARLSPVSSLHSAAPWHPLGNARADGRFDERLRVKAGWYRLEVRAKTRRGMAIATVDRVGVGEVFIVVGHSVAHGGRTNLAGAVDERVNTIAWTTNSASARKDYERTADPRFLPSLVGTQFGNDVVPGPFGHGTYFWAQFAERVVREQDVPVLLLNAAFGGTSLEHWAKSARGERFDHSFVKSDLRMPYINLHHSLRHYATVTGVRAILADQGQNDWPEPDARKVFTNYVAFVEQARTDLGFPQLAVVVNRATPPGNKTAIRHAQERMIRDVPHCFAGSDYDTLAKADRYDGVHLSESGMTRAAHLWAEALTSTFFQQAVPYQPRR